MTNWLTRYNQACVYYPDMRNEGKGYRDCPGCTATCERLGIKMPEIQANPPTGFNLEMVCNFCDVRIPFPDIGKYVQHLIKDHWDILQKLHDHVTEW